MFSLVASISFGRSQLGLIKVSPAKIKFILSCVPSSRKIFSGATLKFPAMRFTKSPLATLYSQVTNPETAEDSVEFCKTSGDSALVGDGVSLAGVVKVCVDSTVEVNVNVGEIVALGEAVSVMDKV